MDTKLVELPESAAAGPAELPTTLADALVRMSEAEDTLRAIGAGEVDAFVVSDGGARRRVFTLSTADRPYRIFVENMRDGAATLSSTRARSSTRTDGWPSCCPADERPSSVRRWRCSLPATSAFELDEIRGPGGLGATVELDLVDGNGATVPVLVEDVTARGRRRRPHLPHVHRSQRAEGTGPRDRPARRSAGRAHGRPAGRTGRAHRCRRPTTRSPACRTGRCSSTASTRRCPQPSAPVGAPPCCSSTSTASSRSTTRQGHAAGDTVLRRVAEQLVSVAPTDGHRRPHRRRRVRRARARRRQPPARGRHRHPPRRRDLRRRPGADDGERVAASVGISVSVGGRGTAESAAPRGRHGDVPGQVARRGPRRGVRRGARPSGPRSDRSRSGCSSRRSTTTGSSSTTSRVDRPRHRERRRLRGPRPHRRARRLDPAAGRLHPRRRGQRARRAARRRRCSAWPATRRAAGTPPAPGDRR